MGEDLRRLLCCAFLGIATYRTAQRGGQPIDVFVIFFTGVAVGFDMFH